MAETKEEKTVKSDNRLAKPGVTVELVKGEQWSDDLSGISLYRGFYAMAARDDMKKDPKSADIGYVKLSNEKSPTAILPNGKNLARVEKALALGILKVFDPKNPTVYKEMCREDKTRALFDIKDQRGFKYRDQEEEDITKLLSLPFDKFQETVNKLKSLSTLEKIYEAEYEGRNPEARPRKRYVDIVKTRLNAPDIAGVGTIKSKVEEKIAITK